MTECRGSNRRDDCRNASRHDRRARGERRRSGLFELRARRDGIGGDRRRPPSAAASAGRKLRALWRRVTSQSPSP